MAAYETHGESDEWYTPKWVIEAIGLDYDLDPASPPEGPRHVLAGTYYCQNGEGREWLGRVWMNPPFGNQETKRLWLARFFSHGHGVALLPDRTSAPWFHEYAPMADALLWVRGKIKFERPDGSIGKSPGTGTVLMACGPDCVDALRRSDLGFVQTKRLGGWA